MRNLLIASIMNLAYSKTAWGSGINIELLFASVPDIEAIAVVIGTCPSHLHLNHKVQENLRCISPLSSYPPYPLDSLSLRYVKEKRPDWPVY